jgi:hypothetical protein
MPGKSTALTVEKYRVLGTAHGYHITCGDVNVRTVLGIGDPFTMAQCGVRWLKNQGMVRENAKAAA